MTIFSVYINVGKSIFNRTLGCVNTFKQEPQMRINISSPIAKMIAIYEINMNTIELLILEFSLIIEQLAR